MADSFNGFDNLKPILKDAPYEEPYAKKLQRLMEKPNSSKQYFAAIKQMLKKKSKQK